MTLSDLEWFASGTKWLAAGATVVAALLGACALYFTSQLTKMQKVELNRFQHDSAVAIASATARSDEANEKAAGANERAKKLEHDNLALRSNVAQVETRAEKAGKELEILKIETAEARLRQAEAEIRLAEVKKRQEPRGLHVALVAGILREAPPGEIILLYHQGSPESGALAEALKYALIMGKWKVLELKGVSSITEGGYASSDITLRMRSHTHKSESVKALERALKAEGLNVAGMGNDPTLQDDVVRLVVNPMP